MLADRSRRAELIALVTLVVLYYAVPWRSLGVAAAWIGPPVAYLLLVVAPGHALVRLLGVRPRDALDAVAWVPLLGLFAALLACFLWALWGFSLDVYRYAFPAVVVALVLAAPPRNDRRLPVDRLRPGAGERRATWALLAFLAVVGAVVWVAGPSTHYQADTIDHVAYVNEIDRTQDPFPRTAFYQDPGPDGADLRKSLLHALFGVFKRHLGVDALALFAFLAGAQLVILCAAAYAASLRMFASRRVALVAALLFALAFDGGIGSKLARSMFYPNRFGMAPLLLFIAAATSVLRKPSRQTIGLCAVFAFTAAAVHVQYIVFVALVAAIVVVWKMCSPCATWREHLERSLAAAIAGGLAILPYALYRFVTSYQTSEMHSEVQGVMFVGGGLFVARPFALWDMLGWMGLAALVGLIPLWRYRRDIPGVGYGIASLLTVLLVVVNPLAMPAAFDVLTYLVYRLGRVVPTYMIAAFLIVVPLSAAGAAARPTRWWRRTATLFALIALVTGAWNVVRYNHVLLGTSAAEKRVSHGRWVGNIARITEGLPDGAVIASDPVTSYYVSAFTPYYVLCALDQHVPPNDRHADARMAAARDILSPFTSNSEKARIAEANRVTHILVNEDLPPGLVLKYWTLDPDVAQTALRILSQAPGTFHHLATRGPLTLFRYTGINPPDYRADVPVVAAPPAGATPIGETSGEADLVAARVEQKERDVIIDLYWTRAQRARPGTYVVSLRFDHVHPDLPLGGKPFPKVARKLKERIEGRYYRFRDDHIMLRGFYGPDRWEGGAIVHDPTTVRIPRGLAPGAYRVEAKLLRVPAMPNTDVRSYFYDDDIYSGVEIGRIEIGR